MDILVAAAAAERITSPKNHTSEYAASAFNRLPTGMFYTNFMTLEMLNSIKIAASPEFDDYYAKLVTGQIKKIVYTVYSENSHENQNIRTRRRPT